MNARYAELVILEPAGRQSPKWSTWAAAVVVAAVTAGVFWPAISAQAGWFDDAHYLHQNHLVKSPSPASAATFLSEVTNPSTIGGYYQPLAMISLMCDYALARTTADLSVYHRTSLILHVANVLFLMTILYRLFGSLPAAALTASLFGLHPITVDSVVWIAERKTVLATFFALIALVCYINFTHRRRPALLAGAIASFLLAAMAKPTVLPLPIAMLLLDFWPLRRRGRAVFIEKIPFFVIAAAMGIITIISQSRSAELRGDGANSFVRGDWMVCHGIWFYVSHVFRPLSIAGYYLPPEPFSWSNSELRLSLISAVVLGIGIAISLRWTRSIFTGAGMFLALAMPTMGLIGFTDVLTANRFAYLPLIGFALPVCAGLAILFRPRLAGSTRTIQIGAGLLAAIIALIACILPTRAYLEYWRDSESLCRHMVQAAPRSVKVVTRYGEFLTEASRFGEALAQFDEAQRIDPEYPPANNNRASALIGLGRYQEARTAVDRALEKMPNDPGCWVNKGTLLAQEGRVQDAIGCYQTALWLRPGFVYARTCWGMALAGQGRFAEAIDQYGNALKTNPEDAVAHDNLGVALAALGRVDEAIPHFREALRLRPEYDPARKHLDQALASTRPPQ